MKLFSNLPMIMLFILSALLVLASPTAKAANNTLLESKPNKEFPASHLPRWQEILNNHPSEIHKTHSKNIQTWTTFISSIQNVPKLRQLLKVNMWFKKFPYKQDNWIYEEEDHWASPTEFLTKGGDCEDFAIIKYMTLRKLGFSAQNMKIAIVYDVYSGTDHAFLVVRHEGAEFVLDNREKLVVVRYMKSRYKPHYAFNENHVWTYDSPLIVQKMRKHSIQPGNR